MSMIFGIRKPVGAFVSEQEVLQLAQGTERYALDGTTLGVVGRIGMGFQPYYTHLRSKLEFEPAGDDQGNLLVFDGRLDSHRDLCRELQLNETSTPDSQIILAAFIRWGEECFSRLVGDWALALWSTKEQALYLAKDHAGTRTLYFEITDGTLLWSTYLDTLVGCQGSKKLDEDYAACYLASQPLRDLTPYKGVSAVLPAHYVVFRETKVSVRSHWNWMNPKTTRYSSNREYDEHFIELFGQSVERRDGPGAPIAAHLSGGMDSTSIVCMSDHRRISQNRTADLLDTISFYDDSEPGWNERPYFSAVEEKRGKRGLHFEMSFLDRTFEPHDSSQGLYLVPGGDSSAIERERRVHAAMADRGYRVILSGIGGDEVLGGVPSPMPELADHLMTGDLNLLLKRTTEWCLVDRSPFFHQLFDVSKYIYSLYRQPHVNRDQIPPWLEHSLRKASLAVRTKTSLNGRRFGLLASSISNGLAWWSVMETMPHTYPCILSRPEYRYPYLDRDLVDYLFSLPPEQLVQPRRRRLLMRRALKGIVPEIILERRRKAYLIRGPLYTVQQARSKIDQLFDSAFLTDRGFIDSAKLKAALQLTSDGKGRSMVARPDEAVAFELWMRSATQNQRT